MLWDLFGALTEQPWLALVPTLVLIVCGHLVHSRTALGAGGVWLLYFLYEMGMKQRLLCSGECNIRIDLMLIAPVLVVGTIAAFARVFWKVAR
jgi:hypothetical protein